MKSLSPITDVAPTGRAEIGIIGGTGVYDDSLLKDRSELTLATPFGHPSDRIVLGTLAGRRIAFINRHGPRHSIPPHMVNSRANIYALKKLGVTRILATGAVGSLKGAYMPGDVVLADQFVDFTKTRQYSFFNRDGVYHVSLADPFCQELRMALERSAVALKMDVTCTGTYVCIEGPRFSTRAESRMYRNFGDIIGMTLVPECQLAREAELCYASINAITDYDVWAENPVSMEEISANMKKSAWKVKRLITDVVSNIPRVRGCECGRALKNAAA
ncbi:MAG: S-methyl-5'-thioadenosine phosphorylase [Candidatus Aenigmarchaeota archaeon]|nr:S-methyl-5'-thioadenosine phosphorylase [Candidatus Aenigmarchaeota archaeon]